MKGDRRRERGREGEERAWEERAKEGKGRKKENLSRTGKVQLRQEIRVYKETEDIEKFIFNEKRA